MSVMIGRDPFIRKLLEALGVPVERMRSFCIKGSFDEVVTVEAEFCAEKPDEELTRRAFELHRPAALEGALSELAGGKIRALEIDEGDVIVFRCAANLDSHQRQYLKDVIDAELPGHRVLVLDGGAEFIVVRAPDSPLDTRSL